MSDNQNVKTPEQIAQEKVELAGRDLRSLKKELIDTEGAMQISIQHLAGLVKTLKKKKGLIKPPIDQSNFLKYCELMVKLNHTSLKHRAQLARMSKSEAPWRYDKKCLDAAESEMKRLNEATVLYQNLDIGNMKFDNLDKIMMKETGYITLSLAVTPIQRVTRYEALGKEIKKREVILSVEPNKDENAQNKDENAQNKDATTFGRELMRLGEAYAKKSNDKMHDTIQEQAVTIAVRALQNLKENSGSTLFKGNKEPKEEGIKTASDEIKKAIDGKYLHLIPPQDLKEAVIYLGRRVNKGKDEDGEIKKVLDALKSNENNLVAAPLPPKKEEPLQEAPLQEAPLQEAPLKQALEGMLQEGAVGTQQRKDASADVLLPPAQKLVMSSKARPRPPATPSPKDKAAAEAKAVAEIIMKDAPPLLSSLPDNKKPDEAKSLPKKTRFT